MMGFRGEKTGDSCIAASLLATCCALLLVIYSPFAAASVTISEEQFKAKQVTSSFRYYSDPTGSLSLDQVRALPENVWQDGADDALRFGFTSDVYWLRIQIEKQTSRPVFLVASRTLFDLIEAYILAPNNLADAPSVPNQRAGLVIPPDERPTLDRRPVFVLDFEGSREIWLRTQTSTAYVLSFSILDQEYYLYSESKRMMFHGAYFSVLLFATLLFFVTSAALRHTALFALGLLTVFSAVTQATVLGFYATELWDPNLIYRNALSFAMGGTLIAAYYFFSQTLELKTASPWAEWGLRAIAGLSLLTMLASSFVGNQTTLLLVTLLVVAAGILILTIGVRLSLLGNRFAMFTVVASSAALVGSMQSALVSLQIVPGHFVSENAVYFGFMFMIFCLTLGLGFEMRNRQHELETAAEIRANEIAEHQQAANNALELEVKNRTQELEQALEELAEANESPKLLNTVDQVTGVKNRYFFDTSFEQEWKRASREHYPISLLMLDVDHFKSINDTYGHVVGDECLRQIADRIHDNIKRASDTLARFGGEEFVVLLPYADNESAMLLAEQVRAGLEATPLMVENQEIPVQLSAGVCTVIPSEQDTPKDLITSADLALYEAKSTGRNRVCNAGMLTVHKNAQA